MFWLYTISPNSWLSNIHSFFKSLSYIHVILFYFHGPVGLAMWPLVWNHPMEPGGLLTIYTTQGNESLSSRIYHYPKVQEVWEGPHEAFAHHICLLRMPLLFTSPVSSDRSFKSQVFRHLCVIRLLLFLFTHTYTSLHMFYKYIHYIYIIYGSIL